MHINNTYEWEPRICPKLGCRQPYWVWRMTLHSRKQQTECKNQRGEIYKGLSFFRRYSKRKTEALTGPTSVIPSEARGCPASWDDPSSTDFSRRDKEGRGTCHNPACQDPLENSHRCHTNSIGMSRLLTRTIAFLPDIFIIGTWGSKKTSRDRNKPENNAIHKWLAQASSETLAKVVEWWGHIRNRRKRFSQKQARQTVREPTTHDVFSQCDGR